MKIKLYGWHDPVTDQDKYDSAVTWSEGLFKLIEWTLVIATLIFIATKTGSVVFLWIGALAGVAMFSRVSAELLFNFEMQFWRPPVTGWRKKVSRVIGVLVSFIGTMALFWTSYLLAIAVAKSGAL